MVNPIETRYLFYNELSHEIANISREGFVCPRIGEHVQLESGTYIVDNVTHVIPPTTLHHKVILQVRRKW